MILVSLKDKILSFLDAHIFFFGVVFLVLTLGWIMLSPTDKLFEKKRQVMLLPSDYKKHLELAEGFLEINNLEAAKKEFDLAIALRQAFEEGENEDERQVLGEESVWEKIRERILEPEKIGEDVEKWRRILDERPDYRDGYLKLAVLYWRMGDEVQSKKNLEEALNLDPNYDLALELKGIIN